MDRLKDETPRAWGAFVRWVERNQPALPALATEMGLHTQSLRRWSAKHRWVERATASDTARLAAVVTSQAADVVEMRSRHLTLARKAQSVCARELDALLARPAGDVPLHVLGKLLEVSTKLEMLATGEPTERTATTWHLDRLTLEELRTMRRLQEKAANALPAPQIVDATPDTPFGASDTPLPGGRGPGTEAPTPCDHRGTEVHEGTRTTWTPCGCPEADEPEPPEAA